MNVYSKTFGELTQHRHESVQSLYCSDYGIRNLEKVHLLFDPPGFERGSPDANLHYLNGLATQRGNASNGQW